MSTAQSTSQSSTAKRAVALQCRGLRKYFNDVHAVDGVDLEIYSGECFGLLGPNGAGKTTTVEILEGLTTPDSGEATVLGLSWNKGRNPELRQRIGVALQETQLSDKLTVEETVQLFRSFYKYNRSVDEVIATVSLEEKRTSRTGKLSGGQKQRLAIACALVGNPDLLFLDEPTTGLDPQARLQLWELISTFRSGGGTILLTTHYMEEAERLCDRVAIMDHGHIIALGTPADLIASLGAEQIVEFSVQEPLANAELLKNLPGVVDKREAAGRYLLTVAQIHLALPALLLELNRQKAQLASLLTHHATLEDVFVALTGRTLRDG